MTPHEFEVQIDVNIFVIICIYFMSYIMASQIKCGSCGFKSDNISRRIRTGWNILKYPARLKLKCVYFKKLYLREKFIKS